MRLKSLSLKNYRQYQDSSIEFGDGITGIVGLNGAGKSTIVEAIAWTLYGNNAARTGKEGIKRTSAAMNASVECQLIMEVGGIEYKIVRVLKGSSQSGDASIIANGKILADSVKGVDKEVGHLLGMDWKSFYTSFFAKQKELNALTDLTPTARRDTIIRMLRIDAVDKIIDTIKKKVREHKLELDVLKKSLKDSNQLLAEKLVIDKGRKESEKELKLVEASIAKLEIEKAKFKEKFNEERAIYTQFNQLDKKKGNIEVRLKDLSKREDELNKELTQIQLLEKEFMSLEKNNLEYLELEKKQKKLSVARESELKYYDAKLEEYRARYKQLAALKPGSKCPTCGHIIEKKEHIEKEMEKLKSEADLLKLQRQAIETEKPISGIDIKEEFMQYTEISKKLDSLEPSHRKYPIVKAKLDKKTDTEHSLAELLQKKNELEVELKLTLKGIEKVPYDEKKYGKIDEELTVVESNLTNKYDMRNEIKSELDRISQQSADKQKEIDDAEKAARDIKDKTLSHEQQEKFINLVTDYRQYLISRIRPKLSEITGNLMAELTDGKYTGAELDEEYNIWIYDGNVKYPIQRFSGGESDIANLCLRLAISQMIAESSGIETGFIILDEIFGSQDSIRKRSIMEALNMLSKKFRQIILITHIEDVKDTLENIIEAEENEEGISYIKD